MYDLNAILDKLDGIPAELVDAIVEEMQDVLWIPNLGPQTEAYFSKADVLLYGGQGGGGKTDLLAGLALTRHKRSLLVRKQYTDLSSLIDRVLAIHGTRQGFNGAPPPKLRTTDGRLIEFGGAKDLDSVETWQGQPHDFRGVDEACQMSEAVVRFLMGWVRDADIDLGDDLEAEAADSDCRFVLASNPPLSTEGQWVIGMFRPWLDITHPNPAKHGELRWFITDENGEDVEVNGPDPLERAGRVYTPKSRTFIPAQLGDNPYLMKTDYQATLDAMPEPIRSAIRDGNFMAAREDDVWQVIPTKWIRAAQERWTELRPDVPMTSIGVDVARGGRDNTILQPRFETWFDMPMSVPGRETPDGPSVVALVVANMRDSAMINVDADGVGASVQDHLKGANIPHIPFNGARTSSARSRDFKFGFVNVRAELWWKFREALDPDYGDNLALPPDERIVADLSAPTYSVRGGAPPKIYIESKKELMSPKRLGRSPDWGDALVYAWAAGEINKWLKDPPRFERTVGEMISEHIGSRQRPTRI